VRRLERLGALVRERRRALGFRTVEDFAAATGVSRRTLGTLERGEARVSDDTAAAVERILRWSPGSVDAILAGGRPSEDPGVDLQRIADAWPYLSERERAILLAVFEVLRTTRD
jgi:transcriptional regulator with XRE-family HTH domain